MIAALMVWAGNVPYDGEIIVVLDAFRMLLALDGGECAEEEIACVGQDGGAAGRDAVLREEDQDLGEKFIDVGRGGQFLDAGHQFGGEIDDGAGGRLKMGVVAAVEAGMGGKG
jgi:hypothetical protein